MRLVFQALIFSVTTVLVVSCSDNEPDPISQPIDLNQPWVYSTPAKENIDDLSAIKNKAESFLRLTSVMVVRNGKIVYEEYFKGFKKDSLHDVRSVTKSVVSLLTGIAIREGFITSDADPISIYLPESKYALTYTEKGITIDNLLTMSGGFEWHENDGNAYNEWILSGEPVNFLLGKPIVTAPGSTFNYNSAAVNLLGVIITEASGKSLPMFAEEYLFSKIGITEVNWEEFDNGSFNGGSGIQLKVEDLARVGQLMLQSGMSAEETIVPGDWINHIVTPTYTWRNNYEVLHDYTYGRLWWLQESVDLHAVFAWGYGGQFVYVVPAKNLVVVTTTNWVAASTVGGPRSTEQEALGLIINDILPKVR